MEKVEGKPAEASDGDLPAMSQAEYSDRLESHQVLVQASSAQLTQLTELLKKVRESKEPLTHVKNTLQEEINRANRAIHVISEEVTLLKQKLRYHSIKQIHDNIEWLQHQLRNNNFKPREEQKILDEISMLQRSIRTLREYEAKQAENKKYRTERTRLIEERNSNYAKIKALYAQEDKTKKEIAAVREVIASNRKSVDQLRQMKPRLEQGWKAQQEKLQAARYRRIEEKKRLRQEQARERQEEKRKLWEEYEASREPYEEEKKLCRVLISYLQSSVGNNTLSSTPGSAQFLSPSTANQAPDPDIPGPPVSEVSSPSTSSTPTTPLEPAKNSDSAIPPLTSGTFYAKTKDKNEGFVRVNKRNKAKARREQRLANRTKDLPHTPDVIGKFAKLSVVPPKNTDEVPATIVCLQDCLQKFHTLSIGNTNQKTQAKPADTEVVKKKEFTVRPTSLPVKINRELVRDIDIISPLGACAIGGCSVSSFSTPSCTDDQQRQLGGVSVLPVINVVSPGTSWSSPVTPSNFPGSEYTSSINQVSSDTQNNQTLFNSVHSPVSRLVRSEVNAVSELPPDIRLRTDLISPRSNESFFSTPVSYPSSFVELNNNAGFSYAAVVAKVKPGAAGAM